MSAHLPDLLEALAEVLLVPGAFPDEAFRSVRGAFWLTPDLDEALGDLLAAGREDAEVAYAGLFLVGSEGPTIHLEDSVRTQGRLAAPEVLEALTPHYAQAGLGLPDRADHLGSLLLVTAALLRRAAAEEGGPALPHLRALLAAHVTPLCRAVDRALEGRASAAPYDAALRLTTRAVDFAARLIEDPA